MQVNVHTARTQLSRLIATIELGEDVVIARGDGPVVRPVPAGAKRKGVVFGPLAGQPGEGPDGFEPTPQEESRLREGRGEEDRGACLFDGQT